MSRFPRIEPPPRVVDASLLGAVVVLLATGAVSLVSGRPAGAWVFDVHAVAGLATVVLLAWKLRRVRHRLRPGDLDATRLLSALLGVVATAALATGIWWVFGGQLDLGPWGLLNLHIGLGLVVPLLLVLHLRQRFALPTREATADRRNALRYAALVGSGAVAWQAQGIANRVFDTAGAERRFTGSRERGSDSGNGFPVTSWVADDPDPVDRETWSLTVDGRVSESLALSYDAVIAGGDAGGGPDSVVAPAERRALLDCTSGWYSEHDWRGVRVGDLLDAADPGEGAAWVQFRSVTGYRWSLPVEEARDALLATHVDGDRLSHGHGAPTRLVAPGRRGFQWVKWVESVRVTRRRGLGEWIAVFVSWVDD
ncbi:oxidoreductase molybdopterin binding protein [Halosimplex carlsbadense 2-9-1]|uniref:Oxidoreductase molybdopterin binding protein n=1 Tax=Halosimplex carlsbadense 2-9-1 TaxID=797114 RepID=M0CHP5_9EURY|nr:molybdopterin-dependent oxidoreductase [Halosimplex carlsbadense]ELZ22756.1 oxidoreductase molybdopterin binding protein [Halosimplex carlsbadense 2-9-1]